jgi:polyisoprenoid-binding protein YceI
MAQHVERHAFSSDRGRVVLLTARDGLAAQAGHDLTIEVGNWSAELTVAEDDKPTALSVRLDLSSLVVIDGTGGLKPLTDRERREIGVTARKVLGVDRHPEAAFTATAFESGSNGGGFIAGSLALGGTTRPLRLHVSKSGADQYHATASIRQSEFGIKPYTAFLGALRVSDVVGIEVDVDLSDPAVDLSDPGVGDPSAGRPDPGDMPS